MITIVIPNFHVLFYLKKERKILEHIRFCRDAFVSENNTVITIILHEEECPDEWLINIDIFGEDANHDYSTKRLTISYNDSSTFKYMFFKSDTEQHICACEDMLQIVVNFINMYSKQEDNWDVVIDKVKHYIDTFIEKHCSS